MVTAVPGSTGSKWCSRDNGSGSAGCAGELARYGRTSTRHRRSDAASLPCSVWACPRTWPWSSPAHQPIPRIVIDSTEDGLGHAVPKMVRPAGFGVAVAAVVVAALFLCQVEGEVVVEVAVAHEGPPSEDGLGAVQARPRNRPRPPRRPLPHRAANSHGQLSALNDIRGCCRRRLLAAVSARERKVTGRLDIQSDSFR
jgi:hypothetical protein